MCLVSVFPFSLTLHPVTEREPEFNNTFILYIFLSHMHKWLNYWQFTLYWVDTLSYAEFIKVFVQINHKILVMFFYKSSFLGSLISLLVQGCASLV